MEITAYFAAALIGISLGLIGGGGSILTVPVLVYLFGLNPMLATSYSLFIVGVTSLVGAYQNYTRNFVNIKTALLLSLSSIPTVLIIRKFILPVLPISPMTTMVLFALLMLAAAFFMIRDRKTQKPRSSVISGNTLILIIYGLGIGLVTGILGAGGGFLLIPALVMLWGLPMKEAIGTSLMIITLNAVIGFMGDFGLYQFDWVLLLKVTAMSIVGLFAGMYLNTKIDGEKLKKGFGWFVLIIAALILVKELKPILLFLTQPWPWYTSGAAIVLIMLLLLYFGKYFGVSSNLRTMCTLAGAGKKTRFFDFDWKSQLWNLLFVVGAILGGLVSSTLLNNDQPLQLSSATVEELKNIGIAFDGNLNPSQLFGMDAVFSFKGFMILLIGGLLVGFGARYAGGCTSGHAISGLANLQLPSLIAVVGFFIGGLATTWIILPLLF